MQPVGVALGPDGHPVAEAEVPGDLGAQARLQQVVVLGVHRQVDRRIAALGIGVHVEGRVLQAHRRGDGRRAIADIDVVAGRGVGGELVAAVVGVVGAAEAGEGHAA